MAAGLGSRYGGYKQIEGVGPNNELLLDYAIFDAINLGFKEVILVINKKIEKWLREHLTKAQTLIPITFIIQEKDPVLNKPPGTAHAAMIAMKASQYPAIVINADDYYGRDPLYQLFEHLSSQSSSAMVGYQVENTLSEQGHVSRGVISKDQNDFLISASEYKEVRNQSDDIVGIEESSGVRRLLNGALVSMNLWGLQASVGQFFTEEFQKHDFSRGEFLLPNSISKGIGEGRLEVKVYQTKGTWFGMTYAKDLEIVKQKVHELVEAEKYPPRLWIS